MNHIDIHKRKTDQAWTELYSRLEEDGLLPDTVKNRPSSSVVIRAVGWVAAITLLCISLAGIYYLSQPDAGKDALLTMINNEDATTLITTLEDGSVVYLAENATLRYPEHFEEHRRNVVLEGNAQFDVSGNEERPFFIETDRAEVEVIGTSFHIRSSEYIPFELVVRQGEVKVTVKGNNENCLVKAGEKVQLLPDGLWISFTEEAEPENPYSSRIRFKDEKLGDILQVLSKEISVIPLQTIPSLEERRFTVAFENNTPDQMAELICIALHLRYVKEQGKIVIMEKE